MDYNNPYQFGDVVEADESQAPRVYVIFGEFDHSPCEGVYYAAGNADTFGIALKAGHLRKIGTNPKMAKQLRTAHKKKAPNALKEITKRPDYLYTR